MNEKRIHELAALTSESYAAHWSEVIADLKELLRQRDAARRESKQARAREVDLEDQIQLFVKAVASLESDIEDLHGKLEAENGRAIANAKAAKDAMDRRIAAEAKVETLERDRLVAISQRQTALAELHKLRDRFIVAIDELVELRQAASKAMKEAGE